MNETYVMLPAAGSLTDFFTTISILANEYQTAGNGVLICIALLILGSKFLIGDDESKARGRKQVPYIIIGTAIISTQLTMQQEQVHLMYLRSLEDWMTFLQEVLI